MKRCPKCNRAESVDSLAFCRADGTRLVGDGSFVSEGALEDSKRRHVAPIVIADYYIRAGDKDRALEGLGKSVEERDGTVVYFKIDRRWDSVRTDPRFAALVRKVGLPQ